MDVADWDARYASRDLVWGQGPNQFVAAELAELPAGRALDVACGEGRNALWLAERGWRAVGVDFSTIGLQRAKRLAADAEVTTESNPDSIDAGGLATLREAGFTRVSFGMQSAVPHVLATLDRVHTPGRAQQAVADGRGIRLGAQSQRGRALGVAGIALGGRQIAAGARIGPRRPVRRAA